jgi:hypothetical protein
LHMTRGDHQASVATVDEVLDLVQRAPSFRWPYAMEIVEVLLRARTLDRAHSVMQQPAPLSARDRIIHVSAQAMVAEAEARLDQALPLYQDAAQRWRGFGFVLARGQMLLGSGRCLAALGRAAEGTDALREAREVFAKLGAVPLQAEADTSLEHATALTS